MTPDELKERIEKIEFTDNSLIVVFTDYPSPDDVERFREILNRIIDNKTLVDKNIGILLMQRENEVRIFSEELMNGLGWYRK